MGLRWWRLRLALRLPLRCVLCRGVGFLLVYEYGFSLDCTLNTLLYLALRVRERERERATRAWMVGVVAHVFVAQWEFVTGRGFEPGADERTTGVREDRTRGSRSLEGSERRSGSRASSLAMGRPHQASRS